jgi:hypothetical protein
MSKTGEYKGCAITSVPAFCPDDKTYIAKGISKV